MWVTCLHSDPYHKSLPNTSCLPNQTPHKISWDKKNFTNYIFITRQSGQLAEWSALYLFVSIVRSLLIMLMVFSLILAISWAQMEGAYLLHTPCLFIWLGFSRSPLRFREKLLFHLPSRDQ